ncbi:MAG: hypothetical protein R3E87_20150 [Burkholderiaceae bacterium]
MRLRLVHLISILLTGGVVLPLVLMGTLTAWNLRQGFDGYLLVRDQKRAQQLAALVASQSDGFQSLQGFLEHVSWPSLLARFNAQSAGQRTGPVSHRAPPHAAVPPVLPPPDAGDAQVAALADDAAR